MKRTSRIAAAVAAALALGLAAAGVNAHPYGYGPGAGMEGGWGPGSMMGNGPGPGYGMGPGHGRGPGFGPGAGARGNPAAAAEARLAYLKSELKITAGQEAAWKTFADQARQQAEAMQALRATMQGSTAATAPERLELRNQIMKKRQEQMEQSTVALKDLYAALTPEQKAIVDQRFAGGPGFGRGFGGGPGGRYR